MKLRTTPSATIRKLPSPSLRLALALFWCAVALTSTEWSGCSVKVTLGSNRPSRASTPKWVLRVTGREDERKSLLRRDTGHLGGKRPVVRIGGSLVPRLVFSKAC